MPKAIIFDIDGTLLDSVGLHAEAWRETFLKFGHDIPVSEIRSQIGKGGDQLMPVFLDKDELERNGKEIEEFRSQLFKEKYLPKVKPFPKVRQLFQTILEHGQKIALASSAKPDELKDYERIAQIEDLVQVETSSGDAEKSKPHPGIFQAALERLKGQNGGNAFSPADVLVVGDSPYDAEAASKLNLGTVGLRCGGFPEEALRKAGCIAIYENPEELLRIYPTSPLADD